MKPVREWMRDPKVAALLAIVAVVAVGYRVATLRARPAPALQEVSQETPKAATQEDAGTLGPVPAAAGAQAAGRPAAAVRWSWDRNPFLPVGGGGMAKAKGAGAPSSGAEDPGAVPSDLRGTVVGGATAVAIFGSRVVATGERAGAWRIDRVQPYGVIMRRGNEVRQVEMFKPPPGEEERTGGER